MKSLVSLVVLLSVGSSFGATQLHVKLEGQYYVNHKEVKVKIPKLNKELKALGLDGLPEVLVISENPEPFFKVIERRIEAANKALNRDMTFNVTHYGYIYELEICYTGSINRVPDVIKAATGNFLNADQGFLAIAAGSKRVVDRELRTVEGWKERFQEEYEGHKKTIAQFLNYKSSNERALVLSDFGPQGDGTELMDTWIAPCK